MKVHVTDLLKGDRLLADTYNEFGLLILSAGTSVDPGVISKLRLHNINYVHIPYRVLDAKEDDHADQIRQVYQDALGAVKNLFSQALQNGKIDEEVLTRNFEPFANHVKAEHDAISLLLTLNDKDDYTYQHSVQVGMLAFFLAKWSGHSEEDALLAAKAGYLHDIGKCRIPETILNKPAKLTDSEFSEMKNHTVYGREILQNTFGSSPMTEVALQHHERLDGTGYPYGILGPEMHPLSKIVAISDIYSAMISFRVYQKERDLLSVLKELHRLSFSQLDAELTQTFIQNMLPNLIGKQALLSDGRTGIIVMTNQNDLFRPLVQVGDAFIDLSQMRHLTIEQITMPQDLI